MESKEQICSQKVLLLRDFSDEFFNCVNRIRTSPNTDILENDYFEAKIALESMKSKLSELKKEKTAALKAASYSKNKQEVQHG